LRLPALLAHSGRVLSLMLNLPILLLLLHHYHSLVVLLPLLLLL
jgi:hypothetical protein